MRDVLLAAAAVLLICGAARGADVAADGGYAKSPAFAAPERYDQSTIELTWDNGRRRWSVAWLSGSGAWVGNDFDVSTLVASEKVIILKYKYYTRGAWPNQRWDGVRLAFYSYTGDVPGSMLWPAGGTPHFFKPNNPDIQSHLWVEFDINWICPEKKFVAAQEQFNKYPACDAFSLDDSTTFTGHTWEPFKGSWRPFSEYENLGPYRNAMIRVYVGPVVTRHDSAPGVAPSSIGRVKALYY
jgi:hypothetical protein